MPSDANGSMRLRFLGANRQVTGSCYVLDAGGMRLMIDCGLFQEHRFLERNWTPCPVPPDSIDVLLLTHAHLDHCGRIPRLVRDGFSGRILATPPSIDLAKIVMEDSARIQEEDAKYKRKRHKREGRKGPYPELPLYTPEDAYDAFPLLHPIEFGRAVALNPHVSVRYHTAGHILGAASVEIIVNEAGRTRRVVFSGDLGATDRVLVPDPSLFDQADYVVMESTYGDRNHPEVDDGDHGAGVRERLAQVIHDTVDRGGNVVIPTFAIERAQALMYHLSILLEEKRIPPLVVFLDSPMAIDVTRVFKRYSFYLDEETQRLIEADTRPFRFEGLQFTKTHQQSRGINHIRGSAVIMAGSGMCTGGRIKHHLRHNLTRPESTILFVGYQAEDTLGREIVEGAEEVRIHGRMYPVEARIERINGLSAHADQAGLLRWVRAFEKPPAHLFLTHGEADAASALREIIERDHAWNVTVPEYLDEVELT